MFRWPLPSIPALVEPSLIDAVAKADVVTVVQHGYAHRNHAPAGARNWELGASPAACTQSVAELEAGRTTPRATLRPSASRRCSSRRGTGSTRQSIERLPEAGFRGLSTFGPRAPCAPVRRPCAMQHACRPDRVAPWSGVHRRRCRDRPAGRCISRRGARGAPTRPSRPDILTHHLDLDAAAWEFLAELFARTRAHGAAAWIDVRDGRVRPRAVISARSA